MATVRYQSNRQPVVHKGANGCMNVALYMKKAVLPGEPIKADNIELLNGKSPNSGDLIVCGSCGKNINRLFAAGYCE
jgi:hypothetical protein